jgi:hypothetical protein
MIAYVRTINGFVASQARTRAARVHAHSYVMQSSRYAVFPTYHAALNTQDKAWDTCRR